MGKLNATLLLIYADGQVIAAQKGLGVTVETDLHDTTNKQSGGWAEHEKGIRNASIDFDALFSTTGLSADALVTYITGRTSLLVAISGGISYPLVGEVDMKSIKLDAPAEQSKSLSGSMKVNGPLYHLKGGSAQLVTDPDSGGTDYDTMTISGITISSAINLSGTAYVKSNLFAISDFEVIKVAVFLTLNSGQAPTVVVVGDNDADVSNAVALVEGLNIVTLTIVDMDRVQGLICLRNTAAANWSLSPLYAFKYVAS